MAQHSSAHGEHISSIRRRDGGERAKEVRVSERERAFQQGKKFHVQQLLFIRTHKKIIAVIWSLGKGIKKCFARICFLSLPAAFSSPWLFFFKRTSFELTTTTPYLICVKREWKEESERESRMVCVWIMKKFPRCCRTERERERAADG